MTNGSKMEWIQRLRFVTLVMGCSLEQPRLFFPHDKVRQIGFLISPACFFFKPFSFSLHFFCASIFKLFPCFCFCFCLCRLHLFFSVSCFLSFSFLLYCTFSIFPWMMLDLTFYGLFDFLSASMLHLPPSPSLLFIYSHLWSLNNIFLS